MKTGIANLPLHGGSCPGWLFPRMKNLGREISKIIVHEYGHDEFLRRISDPYWFQALGCVLAFDWHSSGLTTTVCGALKEAINGEDLGVAVCGGKGAASRKTPSEIMKSGDTFGLKTSKIESLVYASRMSAKVDSACIQDNYQLYHHVFFLTEKGKWSVVQQGMNASRQKQTHGVRQSGLYARRYHWLSENVDDFMQEPELIAGVKEKEVLNMVAVQSKETQKTSTDIVNDMKFLSMPAHHEIRELTSRTTNALRQAYEIQPENYEELVSLRGIGPKSIRALALISQIVYGATPSWEDPVKFSFAVGGKDGYPWPVDRGVMDGSIDILKTAIDNAKIGERDKLNALRRLNDFLN